MNSVRHFLALIGYVRYKIFEVKLIIIKDKKHV